MKDINDIFNDWEEEEIDEYLFDIYSHARKGNYEAKKEFILHYVEKLNVILNENDVCDELNELLVNKLIEKTRICIETKRENFYKAKSCIQNTICTIKDIVQVKDNIFNLDIPTSDEEIEKSEEKILLDQIIKKAELSEMELELLKKKVVSGYTSKEISEETELDEKYIRHTQVKTLTKLRKTYNESF